MAGVPVTLVEDLTVGELSETVSAFRERERRRNQWSSVLAYRHAELMGQIIGRIVSGGRSALPEIYELFPFWTEEEKRELQVAKYRQIMMRYVAAGGEKRGR